MIRTLGPSRISHKLQFARESVVRFGGLGPVGVGVAGDPRRRAREHGTGDVNAPIKMTGRRTAALLPKAQYKEYGNAARGLYLTHANRLDADLLAFIKS